LVDSLNYRLNRGVNTEYETLLEYATLQGFSLPSPDQQILQNRLITNLKNLGIWSKLDIFYLFATDGGADIARINWKNPGAHTITISGTPSFRTNIGFKNNGSFLDTNFIASTSGVNYKLNDASRNMWVYTADSSGVLTALSDSQSERTNNYSTNRVTINSGTNRNASGDGSGTGMKGVYRDSATTNYLYNGTTSYALATTSTTLPASSIRLLTTGVAEMSMYSMGASLINENSDYINAFQTYLTAISS